MSVPHVQFSTERAMLRASQELVRKPNARIAALPVGLHRMLFPELPAVAVPTPVAIEVAAGIGRGIERRIVAVIAAAVAATVSPNARVRSIRVAKRRAESEPWAEQGRTLQHRSHELAQRRS